MKQMDKESREDYPPVVTVSAVHNGREDTREFLESLKQVSYPNVKTLIVDDGSTDGTGEMLQHDYPEVMVLKGDGNLWWTRSANLGIEKAIEAGAKYVLLVDNDTRLDSEFISELVETAEQNPRSIITSKIYLYHQPDRFFEAGWKIDWLRGGFRARGSDKVDEGQYDEQCDVPASTTTSLLINASFFEDIGMLDAEKFPQYQSDIDFTHRAHQKGYRVIYQPKSKIWHKWFATIKKNTPAPTSFRATFNYLTRDPNSAMNFHQVSTFWLRHYPFYMIPYVFFRYAILLILKCWRHNILFLDPREVPILKWFVKT